MTKSLSSNVLKAGWIAPELVHEKRVIDCNELAIKKIEENRAKSERKAKPEFELMQDFAQEVSGVDTVDSLFEDFEESEHSSEGDAFVEVSREPKYSGPSPEEMIEEAARQIESMKAEANRELQLQEKNVLDQARNRGYEEGKQRAQAEYANKEQALIKREKELEMQYESCLRDLEVELVDKLAEVYEHVLGVGMKDYSKVVLHVLDQAMHENTDTKNFLIHVCKEEANLVKTNIEMLRSGLSSQTEVEVIEDVTLAPGEAYIETDGEIFDCSIDTQLRNLSKELKALSFQKNN